MKIADCADKLTATLRGQVRRDELLARHTTWKIGGPADILVIPASVTDIRQAITVCREFNIPWHVLGCGSNLLVRDGGVRGLVIKTAGGLDGCRWQEQGVVAESGVFLPRLAKEAAIRGLTGLEWCAGIPASVGGAVVMNAGVGTVSFADFVQAVDLLDEAGRLAVRQRRDLDFAYRQSSLQREPVLVTAVTLQLEAADPASCLGKIKELLDKRRASQPLEYPTAGSVFKNPPGDFAGRLLEAAGTKGLRSGGAQVSEKHANFIVNLGGARAADVIWLIREMGRRVEEKFQTVLETEIRIIGED